MTAPARLDIHVRYRLAEYLGVLDEFGPVVIERQRKASGKETKARRPSTLSTKSWLYPIGALAFFIKVGKVGGCRFVIDEERIERHSKQGTLKLAWTDVTDVWMLIGAYVIDKGRGAMPLPYRCMNEVERAAFERLAAHRLRRVDATPHSVVPAQAGTQ